MTVIAFSGSREGMTMAQQRATLVLLRAWDARVLVHGDCRGADAEADEIAQRIGVSRITYPSNLRSTRAHTERYGAQPYAQPMNPLARNLLIVETGAALIACPRASSRGTWHAVREARRIGRPVVVVDETGRATS